MEPSSVPLVAVLLVLGTLLGVCLLFFAYTVIRYTPVILRIFTETPVLLPLRHEPEPSSDDIRFQTEDGLELVGTYFPTRRNRRTGVIVFCHEFLGDRWSALPYADCLRDLGFDLFSFDFRNHGESDREVGHDPLQWVSDREAKDLNAALQYLRSRPDHDEAGFGLFGISRGGGTAMAVAADTTDVWGVVTDGAFPTDGTMLAYILRWAEIFVTRVRLWKLLPTILYAGLGRAARIRAEWGLDRQFLSIERAVTRLAPRPLLMIHGERDSYISPQIARALFDRASEPKELWVVPRAKHNGGREMDPDAYRERVAVFFHRWAPRRLPSQAATETDDVFLPVSPRSALLAQPATAV